jgi:hypothetical protein
MRQFLAAFLLFVFSAYGSTEREVAEWVLRWEGRLSIFNPLI